MNGASDLVQESQNTSPSKYFENGNSYFPHNTSPHCRQSISGSYSPQIIKRWTSWFLNIFVRLKVLEIEIWSVYPPEEGQKTRLWKFFLSTSPLLEIEYWEICLLWEGREWRNFWWNLSYDFKNDWFLEPFLWVLIFNWVISIHRLTNHPIRKGRLFGV